MGAPHYTPSGIPVVGADGDSADMRSEFELVETGLEVLNFFPMCAQFEDANTAGDIFICAPFPADIQAIYAVCGGTNSVASTTLTPKIGGSEVLGTGDLVFPSTAVAGAIVSRVPTSNYSVGIGAIIEIETDGGGTGALPVFVTVALKRTA